MGYLYDKNGSQTIPDRRSRFENTGVSGDSRIRGAEMSLRSVMNELEDVKFEPLPLTSKLKKTGLSGYRRSSVEAYVDELTRSTNQLKDNMEQQIQSLSTECMRLKSESQVLRGQILEAEEQTSQVKDMLAAVTGERDAAEQKITETDAELRSLEEKLGFYETENARTEELKSLLQEKTDELIDTVAENDRLKEQIREFSVRVEDINEEFIKFKNSKIAESDEIDSLKQQISLLQENNEELQSALDAAKQELIEKAEQESVDIGTRFHEENIELMRKFSDLYAEYKKELARGNSLAQEKDALSELLEEYQKKERGNAVLRKIDKEQREAIDQMQIVINGLVDEVQHQQEAYERLTVERNENKELFYSLTRETSNLHVENVELLDKNEELQNKNEELQSRITKLEEENERLNTLAKQQASSTVIPLFQAEQADDADPESEDPFFETMKKIRSKKSFNM